MIDDRLTILFIRGSVTARGLMVLLLSWNKKMPSFRFVTAKFPYAVPNFASLTCWSPSNLARYCHILGQSS